MKKLLPVIIVSIFLYLASCSSPQSRAERSTKQFFEQSLASPSSLKNLQFGTLDTLYKTFEETDEAMALRAKSDSLKRLEETFEGKLKGKDWANDTAILNERARTIELYLKKSQHYKATEPDGRLLPVSFILKNKRGKEQKDSITVCLNLTADSVRYIHVYNDNWQTLLSKRYWQLIKSE